MHEEQILSSLELTWPVPMWPTRTYACTHPHPHTAGLESSEEVVVHIHMQLRRRASLSLPASSFTLHTSSYCVRNAGTSIANSDGEYEGYRASRPLVDAGTPPPLLLLLLLLECRSTPAGDTSLLVTVVVLPLHVAAAVRIAAACPAPPRCAHTARAFRTIITALNEPPSRASI